MALHHPGHRPGRSGVSARTLSESGPALVLPKTVALELAWVLCGYYGFSPEQVLLVLIAKIGHQEDVVRL